MSVVDYETIVLHSPSDFAAAIPMLVGFTPSQSIVIVMLQQRRVIVTMRIDIPNDWASDQVAILSMMSRLDVDEILIAVVTQRLDDNLELKTEIQELVTEAENLGITTREAVLIDAGRFWSYLCEDSECCDPTGKPIGEIEGFSTVLSSRAHACQAYGLKEAFQPDVSLYRKAYRMLSRSLMQKASVAWDALNDLSGLVDTSTEERDRSLARAIVQVGCQDVRIRDYLLGRIMQSEDPGVLAEGLVDAALTASVETRDRVCGAAAAVLAAVEPSTLPAACLVDHAGEDSLADLVRRSIAAGMHPGIYHQMLTQALPQVLIQLAAEGQGDA